MTERLDALLSRRAQLLRELTRIGDMRQGTISENYRRCGKPNCRCSDPDHSGHGPYYAFTRKLAGRTKTTNLRPGPRLTKLRNEVAEYQRFRGLCREVIQVNEEICTAGPVAEEGAGSDVPGSAEKKRRRLRSSKTRR
jgi:hypothetical protein